MPNKSIKTSFNAGELSPYIDSRVDLSKFFNGCSTLVNGTVLPYGGVVKRSGTQFIAKARGECRLIPFEFSADDTMVLELSNLYARFYKNNDRVMSASQSMGNANKAITVFANAGGGEITVTATGHGFITNDYVTITGTTNYNGTFKITRVTDDTFKITIIGGWIANDATGTATLAPVRLGTGEVVQIGKTAHGLSTGNVVRFTGVSGTNQLNYNGNQATEFTITVVTVNSFTLDGTDGDDFTAYSSSGTFAKIYEIVMPYLIADVFGVHLTTSADVIYLTHEDYPPQTMTRLADNSWTIANTIFNGGPFLTENTDSTKTLAFLENTKYITGVHTAAATNATVLTDTTKSWVDNAYVGLVLVNTTDGCGGKILSNTATTITVNSLAGGANNDFRQNNTYKLFIKTGESAFYHEIGDIGTLEASGHTPFDTTSPTSLHIGSLWEISKTRVGDNYVSISGITASGSESMDIPILGEFNVSCSGFSTTVDNTLILQRNSGNNVWQDVRKFTTATVYSGKEEEDNISYRLRYTGSNSGAGFNGTLTASNQISKGVVKVTSITDNNTAIATITSPVFRDLDSDISVTGLDSDAYDIVVTAANTLANGDLILFKNVSSSGYTNINYSKSRNNIYTVFSVSSSQFRIIEPLIGSLAPGTGSFGEFYVVKTTTTSYQWSEGAWSAYRGYPRTLAFHEDRLWYAGTLYRPQSIWGSRSSNYNNFTIGDGLDNDSVQITINDSDVSQIQWLYSDETLMVGTVKKEYKVSASNQDDPITPDDVKAKIQSSNGSLSIQPVMLNNSIFYAQGQGRKIRAMRFVDTLQRFESDDATLLSNHLFEYNPIQFAIQRIPDSILWVIRSDGTLCSFSYEPSEEVVAWARHVTGSTLDIPVGLFTSCAVIRGTTEDDLWVTVKRIISGKEVYYIEKMSTRIFDAVDEALMLDCAKIASSNYDPKNIVYASDTVIYNQGTYGSSIYGVL